MVDNESGTRPRRSLLAIDFGLRRMGVASGSSFMEKATALQTVPARNGMPDWRQLDKLVAEWRPDLLVLGLPRNADGTESEMTKAVLEFADTLKEHYQLPVEFVDERYTSAEAESLLRDQRRQGLRNKKLTKEDVDAMAACLIAESWIRNAPGPA